MVPEYLKKFDYYLIVRNAYKTNCEERKAITRKLMLLAILIRTHISLYTFCINSKLNYYKIEHALNSDKSITEIDYIKIRSFAKRNLNIRHNEFIGDTNKIYEKYMNHYFRHLLPA